MDDKGKARSLWTVAFFLPLWVLYFVAKAFVRWMDDNV